MGRAPEHKAVTGISTPFRGAVALVAFCACVCAPQPAAALSPERALTQYTHDVWLPDDGLPQVSVQALVQTQDGYLWFATQEGLVRFDGVRFVVFDKTNTSALAGNHIDALAEGRDGTLWIGTSGSSLVRYRDGEFKAFTSEDGLAADVVPAILETSDGTVWIGTTGGLNRLVGDTMTVFDSANGMSDTVINTLAEGPDGSLWIGTRGGGVNRFLDGAFEVFTTDEGLSSNSVEAVYTDSKGRLWIGTEGDDLHEYKDGRIVRHPAVGGVGPAAIRSLWEDGDGNLWIGTLHDGLYRYHDGQFDSFSTADGLPHNHVSALLSDREGSLWVGTYGGGLNRLRESPFTSYSTREGLSHNEVWAVLEDRSGGMWIGAEIGLDFLQDRQLVEYPDRRFFATKSIMSLFQDSQGALWVGTYGQGVFQLADGRRRVYSTANGLANDKVFSITEAPDGRIWVGTNAGVSVIDGGKITSFTTDDGLPAESVRGLHVDREGTLWLGTRGGGFARLVDGRIEQHPASVGLLPSQALILSIYEDDDGMWFGTMGGLLHLRNDRLRAYTTADGMFDDNAYRILGDDAGRLWLSCNRGIYRVAKADLAAFSLGEIETIPSHGFNRAHGMPSDECNGGAQPAGWRSTDGRLWFPTIAGVLAFDPKDLEDNRPPPPALLEEVHVEHELVDHESVAVFPAGSRRFDFRYTALTFLGADDVQFRYRMDGLDKDWEQAGSRRVAYYSHIPPGEYTFRVAASNGEGVWSEQEAVFRFELKPYFHETTWFWVLCILGALNVLFGYFGLRVRGMRRKARELERAVDERTRELQNLAEQLKELSLNDPLTGLRNRRFLYETMTDRVESVARRRARMAAGDDERRNLDENVIGVFLLDLDHFKEVNDTLGHDAGDLMLKALAETLKDIVRTDDVVVRWGGEEFLIVLPITNRNFLRSFANRVLSRVANTEVILPDGTVIKRSCSIGFTSLPFYNNTEVEMTFDQVIGTADLGMYVAKDEGRNRAVRITPGDNVPTEEELIKALADLKWAVSKGFFTIHR